MSCLFSAHNMFANIEVMFVQISLILMVWQTQIKELHLLYIHIFYIIVSWELSFLAHGHIEYK